MESKPTVPGPALDYANKLILAPMVRVSTLPMRLLALRYGADIVYCEEIIDFKILGTTRFENEVLGTVDYVSSDETVVFRTCREEKGKVVFQMGTSDAKRALQAAKKIEKDVAGIDINMGCPKEFSIKGGMGAALLTKPEKVKDILTTLVNGLSIPVTCKIRLLPELEDTLELVKMIESTGVAAIAVHGRTKEERPRHPNRNQIIKIIAASVKIPVIANGGSKELHLYDDITTFLEQTGCTSAMIARAAEWNPTIFRKEGKLPLLDVCKEYVKVALEYNNVYTNIKYCILNMMHEDMELEEGQRMLGTMSQEEISDIWGHREYFEELKGSWKQKESKLFNTEIEISVTKSEEGKLEIVKMPVRFLKKDYPEGVSAKQRLFEWVRRMKLSKPVYTTVERPGDRYFNSVLTIEGTKYSSTLWDKSKSLAEQGAAIVATIVHNIDDGRKHDVAVQTEAMAAKWKQLYGTEDFNNSVLKAKQKSDLCVCDIKENNKSKQHTNKRHKISDSETDLVAETSNKRKCDEFTNTSETDSKTDQIEQSGHISVNRDGLG